MRENAYEFPGVVEAVRGNNNYHVRVTVGEAERVVLCHLSGKMRQFNIGVLVGDKVRVVVPPPHDKGRIVFRERG